MKTVTLKFVVLDEEEDNINHEIENCHLINDWPLFWWTTEKSEQAEEDWYKEEYLDGE